MKKFLAVAILEVPVAFFVALLLTSEFARESVGVSVVFIGGCFALSWACGVIFDE